MADAQRGVDLKDEDEVKDYLERLGVEYRFGCYYEKDGKGKNSYKHVTNKMSFKNSFVQFLYLKQY